LRSRLQNWGMKMVVASPKGYELDWGTVEKANSIKADSVSITNDPVKAVAGADVIYTDTWVSMGQENKSRNASRPLMDSR